MNIPTYALIAVLIAYLVGSLPFGYLVARFIKGTDIRTRGSGNIGATNVARTLGLKWGILVFFLDAIKGALPVWLLPRLLLSPTDFESMQIHFEVLCGLATVLGHIFPVWLKFRGGKGVATSAGVVLMISPKATLVAVLVYAVVLWRKRIGSLASLAAAGSFFVAHIVLMVLQGKSLLATEELSRTVFVFLMPLVIVIRHKNNLVRLLRGEEPQFGAKSQNKPDAKSHSLDGRQASSESHRGSSVSDSAGKTTREEQESA